MSKVCCACKAVKDNSEFGKHRRSSDGLAYRCQACANASSLRSAKKHPHTSKLWRKNNPDRIKAKILRDRYWPLLTIDEAIEAYDSLMKSHDSRCAICNKNKEESGRTLHVDHDHNTGKVRGLLCNNCNVSLGKFNESADLLRKAADYLETK